jgi:methyl-accepting chemotaxis protein
VAHQKGLFDDAFRQTVETAAGARIRVISAVVVGLLVVASVGFWLTRRLNRRIRKATQIVQAVASGDLQCSTHIDGSDEVAELGRHLERMCANLRRLIASIDETAKAIRLASVNLTAGSRDLNSRTEHAADQLSQVGASMLHMNQSVRGSADSGRQANQLAMSASEVAVRGGEVVGNVVSTMNGISASSHRIAEIIGVIDGIAFQTNILALNAAVEAARAGEQGRGFSVVAGEVRVLAQRSAEAASQIKALITRSVTEVESGSRLVEQAGATMQEIVISVRRVTDIIGEMSAASGEQSGQLSQIAQALGQLETVTQQNSGLAEQSSAAVQALSEQAEALTASIARFSGTGVPAEPTIALAAAPGAASTGRCDPAGRRARPRELWRSRSPGYP